MIAQFNIRVNTVAAGYIHSERWLELAESTIERRHKNIPLGKEYIAEDIAKAVMFLASEDSSKTIGTSTQLIPADCDL